MYYKNAFINNDLIMTEAKKLVLQSNAIVDLEWQLNIKFSN